MKTATLMGAEVAVVVAVIILAVYLIKLYYYRCIENVCSGCRLNRVWRKPSTRDVLCVLNASRPYFNDNLIKKGEKIFTRI